MSLLWVVPHTLQAQSGSRSAAAEAYDRGTAAYLDGNFERAAQWFETANRLAPAAPALMQAVRAHAKAGNTLKASSLALRLKLEYGAEPQAVQYADATLDENAGQYARVDVVCEECNLEVDGSVQEYPSFFVEAGIGHTVTASFETGSKSEQVDAAAGETVQLSFQAPPPPPPKPNEPTVVGPQITPEAQQDRAKPLGPVLFFVGVGATVGLTVGGVVASLNVSAAVDDFNAAADKANACSDDAACDAATEADLRAAAEQALEDADSKTTPRTVLWVATGVVAAATATIGIFFTDWGGGADDDDGSARVDFSVAPLRGGAFAVVQGRF